MEDWFLGIKFLIRRVHAFDCVTYAMKGSLFKSSVAEPDPGSGAFLTPGSGMGKNSRSRFRDEHFGYISESLKTIFWLETVLRIRIRDPGLGAF